MTVCRNPACESFGAGASAGPGRGRAGEDRHRVPKSSDIRPDRCLRREDRGRTNAIKSDRAIAEEIERLSRPLRVVPEPGRPTADRENPGTGIRTHEDACVAQGRPGRSRRRTCRACGPLFSMAVSALRGRRKPRPDRTVFAELVTRKPIRGIMEATGPSAAAVRRKIDVIHRQCLAFAGDRERRRHRLGLGEVRLGPGRQDAIADARSRRVRKSDRTSAPRTAEANSGYGLGQHPNDDPDRDAVEIEDAAAANGGHDPRSAATSAPIRSPGCGARSRTSRP